MTEWTFEDICDLLDQAKECGIHDFTITGVEPMVHKRFTDIIREIYKRDMQLGIHLVNLHKDKLKNPLTSSSYLDNVCSTVGDVFENSPKCHTCKWFEYCTGGCRAMELLFSGKKKDFYGEDITKCVFFENSWYEKIVRDLSGYENLSKINMSKIGV